MYDPNKRVHLTRSTGHQFTIYPRKKTDFFCESWFSISVWIHSRHWSHLQPSHEYLVPNNRYAKPPYIEAELCLANWLLEERNILCSMNLGTNGGREHSRYHSMPTKLLPQLKSLSAIPYSIRRPKAHLCLIWKTARDSIITRRAVTKLSSIPCVLFFSS